MIKVVQLEISRIAFGTRSISCRNTPTRTHAIELVGCAGLSELAGKFPTSRLPEAHWHHKPICFAPSPKRKVWLVVWQMRVGRSVAVQDARFIEEKPDSILSKRLVFHRGDALHQLARQPLVSRGRQASAPSLSPRRLAKSSARHHQVQDAATEARPRSKKVRGFSARSSSAVPRGFRGGRHIIAFASLSCCFLTGPHTKIAGSC